MELVKKLENCIIYKKKSGRFAVMSNNKKFINGEEKANILHKEGLIKLTEPKKEEVVEEAAAEETEQA